MTQNIFTIIRNYEYDFLHRPVQIVDGYYFDQRAMIKRAHLYAHSQFEGGNEDELGEKIFFQILVPRVRNSAKNLDLDTKNVGFRAINGKDYFRSWIYRRSAQQWMRDNKFGHFLNSIPEDLVSYGSVVVKKVPDEKIVEFVNLRNLMNDPTAENLNDSWVIEDHYYTPTELEMMKGKWDSAAIDKAVTSFRESGKENYVDLEKSKDNNYGDAQYILIREFYGDVQRSLITDNPEHADYVRGQFIVVMPEEKGMGKAKYGKKQDDEQGLILFRGERKREDSVYKEVHYRRVKGRWLGIGMFEEGTEMQVFKNEQMNALRMAFQLAKLIIFQTGDETIAKNILTDLQNGDILKFKEKADGLSRVDTRVHDTQTSQMISNEIERLTNSIANSFEVTTGATLPSGTPFSLGQLLDQNANKLFDFIREDFGLFIQEIFEDWVLPQLEKDLNKAHILELTDADEVKMIHDLFVKQSIWEGLKKLILQSGRLPTIAEIDLAESFLRNLLTNKKSVFLDIPKNALKFEKKVEVVVTDEREDLADTQTISSILQIAMKDPSALETPIMQKIMDKKGYNVLDFKVPALAAPENQPAMATAGAGSMPIPSGSMGSKMGGGMGGGMGMMGK